MEIELKGIIESQNKILEALRTDSKASAEKVARMEADLAKTISEKSALEARLNAVETASARPGTLKGATVKDEHKEAFVNFLRKSDDYGVKQTLQAIEQKAIEVGVAANGGNAVPSVISNEIATAVLDFSPIRGLARVVTVGNQNYSELLATAMGSGWSGEDDTRADTATSLYTKIAPTFGEVFAVATVSNHALNDVFFDVEAFVVAEAARQFAATEGTAFISGNGTDKPTGILNGTTVSTIASGVAADFGTNPFDNLLDLRYGVKGEYAQNGSFLLNSGTLARLAKVKSTTGEYIYQPAIAAGVAETLLGKPVFTDENMPSIAAGAKVAIFGDFSRGYLIADIAGMSVIVDNVTQKGYTKFYINKRVSGVVKDANALKALRIAAA